MSPKKSWITQIKPNEKRKQAQPGKESQQEQQGRQQHSEYGVGSSIASTEREAPSSTKILKACAPERGRGRHEVLGDRHRQRQERAVSSAHREIGIAAI